MSVHDEIKEFRDGYYPFRPSAEDVALYRRYVEGKKLVSVTAKEQKFLRGVDITRFSDNICKQIITEGADRIEFQGYSCKKNKLLEEFLKDIYATRSFSTLQALVTATALTDGNTVVSVGWDEEENRVRLVQENWWDGTSGVFLYYDEEMSLQFAVKQWMKKVVDGMRTTYQYFRTVYYADRIERYFSTTGGYGSWEERQLDTDVSWPQPNVDAQGNPIGIPFVHFRNFNPISFPYGDSELSGGLIGMQDMQNRSMLSMSVCENLTGFQQYWASGVKIPFKTGTTVPIDVSVEPGKFHTSSDPASKFGVLEAGDMSQIISSYNTRVKRIAQIAKVPVHAITGGDWPSGDALLRAELPAVSKARKQIVCFGQAWIDLAAKIMQFYTLFGTTPPPSMEIEQGQVSVVFADPENRDDISKSIVVHNLAANVSKKEALRIMGYNEETVQAIYDELMDEAKDGNEMMLNASLRGNAPVPKTTTPPTEKKSEGGNKNLNEEAK